jgi:hypothetical protein
MVEPGPVPWPEPTACRGWSTGHGTGGPEDAPHLPGVWVDVPLSEFGGRWLASADTPETSLPHQWSIRGVALGPRQADPVIRSETWVAWARGPNGERVEGEGDSPEQAMADLANELRPIRSDPNG